MTAGQIAAIVLSTVVVGGGAIGLISASGYNKYKYGEFTPYIPSETKNMVDELRPDFEELADMGISFARGQDAKDIKAQRDAFMEDIRNNKNVDKEMLKIYKKFSRDIDKSAFKTLAEYKKLGITSIQDVRQQLEATRNATKVFLDKTWVHRTPQVSGPDGMSENSHLEK